MNLPFGNVFVKYHDADNEAVVTDPQETPANDLEPGLVDSVTAAEILGVTGNNLRQLVHKKSLTPVGRRHRRTVFEREEVEALAARRKASAK